MTFCLNSSHPVTQELEIVLRGGCIILDLNQSDFLLFTGQISASFCLVLLNQSPVHQVAGGFSNSSFNKYFA